MGRPTNYNAELAATICAELADGKSLRSVCRRDDMPSMVSVFNWLRIYPEFLKQYEAAKEESADAHSEDMLEIADEPPPINANGGVDSGAVADKRLRIDTRKWLASKLKPKKYGDKLQQEVSGPNGGPISTVSEIVVTFTTASDESQS